MDEALKERLEEERHQELLGAINLLGPALQKGQANNQSYLKNFIEQNRELISKFVNKLSDLKAPDINVETNQEAVIDEIKRLRESNAEVKQSVGELIKIMSELLEEEKKPRPLAEWDFELVKNAYGLQRVKAKQLK